MALPFTDSFTAADGTSVASLSGWTEVSSRSEVLSNHIIPADSGGGGIGLYYNSSETYGAAHKAQTSCTTSGSNFRRVGPAVCVQPSSVQAYWYAVRADYVSTDLYRIESDSTTLGLINAGILHTGTHTYRLEFSSGVLSPYYDGTLDPDIGDQSDGTYTGGAAGIATLGNGGTTNYLDDFSGDNVGGGGGGSPFTQKSILVAFS